MFENSLLQSSARRAAIPMGYVIDGALLALLVLYPLIHMQALPKSAAGIVDVVPSPPPAAPSPVRTATPARRAASTALSAPVAIPNFIARAPAAPELAPAATLAGGVPWGNQNGLSDDLWNNVGAGVPAPPPRPARLPAAARVRVGGQVEAAKLILQVEPRYPALAQAAHVQGTVRLEAVISPSGTIQSLRAVSGPPLLIQAAVDAVARWRYQPTLLNGEPVEVSTEIDVTFKLGE
ncbi:MAG TPA: energy transducer TonB [Terriglobia bacterium]|nr:energy transducer TonB [Terriglobia bacterium]